MTNNVENNTPGPTTSILSSGTTNDSSNIEIINEINENMAS